MSYPLFWMRYVDWFFTTPFFLLDLCILANACPWHVVPALLDALCRLVFHNTIFPSRPVHPRQCVPVACRTRSSGCAMSIGFSQHHFSFSTCASSPMRARGMSYPLFWMRYVDWFFTTPFFLLD